jgi:SAM-dependent methyltransferase
MSGAEFDRHASNYDNARGKLARGEQLGRQIGDHLHPGVTLEIGIGGAVIATALKSAGFPVFGVDVSREMLRTATGRIGYRVALGQAEQLPIRSCSVMNVCFAHVLHYLSEPDVALRNAGRVLVPEGRLVLLHGTPYMPDDELGLILKPLEMFEKSRWDDLDGVLSAATRTGFALVHAGFAYFNVTISPSDVWNSITQSEAFVSRNWSSGHYPTVVRSVLAGLKEMPSFDCSRIQTWRVLLTTFRKIPVAEG